MSCSKRPGSRHQASTPAARQDDEVADPLAEARRDARAEDALGRELRRRHDPRVVAEQLPEQPGGLVERAVAHVQEEVARRARRRQRPAVGAAAQERHELRTALVDVDAARRVGRHLAVIGEHQHERARSPGERLDELVLHRLEQLDRNGLRPLVAGAEVVARRVELVEVEQRQRRRGGLRERGRQGSALRVRSACRAPSRPRTRAA